MRQSAGQTQHIGLLSRASPLSAGAASASVGAWREAAPEEGGRMTPETATPQINEIQRSHDGETWETILLWAGTGSMVLPTQAIGQCAYVRYIARGPGYYIEMPAVEWLIP